MAWSARVRSKRLRAPSMNDGPPRASSSPDGDEPRRPDEDVDLLALGGVGDDEGVVGVVLELGPLVALPHVLHGQRVQGELLLHHGQVGLVGRRSRSTQTSWSRPGSPRRRPEGRSRGRRPLRVAPGGDHAGAILTARRTCAWRSSTEPGEGLVGDVGALEQVGDAPVDVGLEGRCRRGAGRRARSGTPPAGRGRGRSATAGPWWRSHETRTRGGSPCGRRPGSP